MLVSLHSEARDQLLIVFVAIWETWRGGGADASLLLLHLDQKGHITTRQVVTSGTDEQVIAKTEQYLKTHPHIPYVELWQEDRYIKWVQQMMAEATLGTGFL